MYEKIKKRINDRYFRQAVGSPDGAIVHWGDCRIYQIGICDCGLLHELEQIGNEELVEKLYPNYEKEIIEMMKQTDILEDIRRKKEDFIDR